MREPDTFSPIILPGGCWARKARGHSCAAAWVRFRRRSLRRRVHYGAEIYSETSVTKVRRWKTGARAASRSRVRLVRRARGARRTRIRATTFLDLLDAIALERRSSAKVKAWKSVGPSLKVNLALGELPNFTCRPGTNPQPHHLATIHVAPSIDYLEKAYADARERR